MLELGWVGFGCERDDERERRERKRERMRRGSGCCVLGIQKG